MAEFPVLETRRLALREFCASDAPAILNMFSQEAVTRYHNVETMQSMEEAVRLVQARQSLFGRGLGLRWAIALRARPDTVIGSCGFYNVNKGFRSVEIGYDLHPAHWRQGIMSEALTALVEFGFGGGLHFPLNRIEALIALGNEASVGLLKKLGFQEEGIRREYGYWKNQFHDLRCLALLRRDWPA